MTVTVPTPLDPGVEAEIQRLLSAGEHAAAAAALRHHGQPARAAKLYESLFEHRAALSAWEAAGDVVAAVRVAMTLGDADALHRLVSEAIATGQGDALITALQRAGRHAEVGRVYLARGEPLQAARAFEAAEAWSDAARCHEELGQVREAGLLLERWLERHPDDDGAALRLGRILARFGRHDDAITLLQRAVRTSSTPDAVTCRAAPTMALAFVALGYEEAARAVVTSWRAAFSRERARGDTSHEAPPADLEGLLSSARAAAFQAVQETDRAPSSPPRPSSSPSSSPPSSSPPTSTSTTPSSATPSSPSAFDALLGDAPPSSSPTTPSTEVAPAHVEEADRRLLLNGRYLLGEPLGGGGVGQVFRAYDAFSDRAVAVKIFGEQVLSSEAVTSWAREVRAAANLEHPALVRLVELNMAQGFVVTELHGEDDGAVLLEERLRQGGDAGWLIPTLSAMLDALSACHRTGLVHGGLKPRNVFLVQGGVKLLDTGAHRLSSLRATETGGLASAWPYLSPELLFGAPADVDGDLYAVAAIAWRALVGQPPFSAVTADRRVAPLRADVARPGVPKVWADFLEQALSSDRGQRFADATAMLQALPRVVPGPLPPAVPVEGVAADRGATPSSSSDRYVKGALVEGGAGLRTWEAWDALVNRPVWLVERADVADGPVDPLAGAAAAARLWRGVQPVYDLVVDDAGRVVQVILARHPQRKVADLAELRAVPQGLARDLAAVAAALASLHKAGFAVDGFPVVRAIGPIGPRLRLAPSPPLVPVHDDAIARDWQSFGALVDAAFAAAPDDSLDARGRLLAALHNGRLLERDDLEALARERDAPWPRFLEAVVEHLVRGAGGRTVARLVASVVRG
jgi:tetratricopeptide (TPR) repeat protein